MGKAWLDIITMLGKEGMGIITMLIRQHPGTLRRASM
jgi:hypothetical protein